MNDEVFKTAVVALLAMVATLAVSFAVHAETFTATAYCSCRKCCGKWADGITASGTTATAGRTIAVDKRIIPLGTHVLVDGEEYIAEDTGVRGKKIDIYFDSHKEALKFGRQTVEVEIIDEEDVKNDTEGIGAVQTGPGVETREP